ncbi:MAG: hypothetical protein RL180_446, partial [Pseudomonadota bacterium]
RGFTARNDVFVDGMRDRAQISRDTAFLQKVEVLKGSAAMAFGRGGVGGVVNQSVKHAQKASVRELSVAAGTEQYGRVTVDVNDQLADDVYGRVAAYGQKSDSTRNVVEREKYGLLGSLRVDLDSKTALTGTYIYHHSNDTPDYGVPFVNGKPAQVDKKLFYGLADDHFEQDTHSAVFKVEHKASKNLTVRNQLSAMRSEVDARPTTGSVSVTEAVKPYSQMTLTRGRPDRQMTDENLFNQSELVLRVKDSMGFKHQILAGVEVGRETAEVTRYRWTNLPSTNILTPNPDVSLAGATRGYNYRSTTSADSLAVYLQDQIALTDDIKALVGVRWDQYAADYYRHTLETTGAVTILDLSRTDKKVNPRLGLMYQPSDEASYYVSYGTAFSPSAETLTLTAATVALKPEESRTVEMGAKWILLNERLGINVAVYDVEKTNMRTPDPITGTSTILDGRAGVRGVELEVNGRVTNAWQVLASTAFMDSEIKKTNAITTVTAANGSKTIVRHQGNELANNPSSSASLWNLYNLTPEWQLGGGAFYMSKRYANDANTLSVPSYVRVDATVAYQQKDYDVRLNLKNLTDETIYEEVSGGRAVPADGTTAQLSLTYRF